MGALQLRDALIAVLDPEPFKDPSAAALCFAGKRLERC
jgi:hypothetical protein